MDMMDEQYTVEPQISDQMRVRHATAKNALVELEQRLSDGDPVGREERRTINAEYQEAERAIHDEIDRARRLTLAARDQIAQGADPQEIAAEGAATTQVGEAG